MLWRIFPPLVPLLIILGGCIAQPPVLRMQTKLLLDRVQLNEATEIVPDEYVQVVALLDFADGLHRRGEYAEAERAYQSAWEKGRMLESRLERAHQIRSRSAITRTESELLVVSRQRALIEEQRRLSMEEEASQRGAESAMTNRAEKRDDVRPRHQRERPLVAIYTVKRGESLPQIAARPEVYGDSQLWPLIYRANRDQVSDPRRLWPGQTFRIPRNIDQDDLAEARRFAQKSKFF